jgi:hypothetical protein
VQGNPLGAEARLGEPRAKLRQGALVFQRRSNSSSARSVVASTTPSWERNIVRRIALRAPRLEVAEDAVWRSSVFIPAFPGR